MPLANMIFILAFVTIAIATILGIEAYGIKKLLPVLIIMALLVNFAPVFVGLIVDAGNIIVYYFVRGIGFEKLVDADNDYISLFISTASAGFSGVMPAATFSQYLTWAVLGKAQCEERYGSCGELSGPRGNLGGEWSDFEACIKDKAPNAEETGWAILESLSEKYSEDEANKILAECAGASNQPNPGILAPTIYLIGAAVAMVMAIGTLMTMTALFLVRNLAIWLLVILAPLAFAAYILPATRDYFKKWWQYVIQWSFIGVAASFFLYLATQMLEVSSSIDMASIVGDELLGNIIALLVTVGFPVIVMVIGLFAAVKSGGTVGAKVIGGVKKLGKLTAVGTGAAIGYTALKGAEKGKGVFGKPGTSLYNWASKLEDSKWTPIKPGALTGHRPEEVEKHHKKWQPRYANLDEKRLGAAATELAGKEIGGYSTIGKRREARAWAILEAAQKQGIDIDQGAWGKLKGKLEKNPKYKKLLEKTEIANPHIVSTNPSRGLNRRENLDLLFSKMTRHEKTSASKKSYWDDSLNNGAGGIKDRLVVEATIRSSDIKDLSTILSSPEKGKAIHARLTEGAPDRAADPTGYITTVKANIQNIVQNPSQANELIEKLGGPRAKGGTGRPNAQLIRKSGIDLTS
ncbi:MAG: type IV secretion system protein [Candidatus Pacebacteria bacterium]|nr:type IV secretion system protein [Candidatus Paceibacterota bacterium]